jgi:3-oxoacyl-[acyl-carrier protein] reductase
MTERKRALITGATGGIGQAIALRLAKDHHVILHTHRQLEKANTLKSRLIEAGGSAEVCQGDISDASATQHMLETLLKAGPIQILINNAGFHQDMPMAGMTQAAWQNVIDTNLNGFFNVTQPLLLPMMSTRWGRIISVSSVAAIMGNRGQANYSAAKAGLHGASKSLSLEVASRGITVNVVAPGVIETDMSDKQFDAQQIKQLVPMQRAGSADEVAAFVAFLASEDAGYISGQVLSINGAMA